MAEETHMPESIKPLRKRKSGHKKGNKAKKKQKQFQGIKERVKIDPKMKKFLRKKARDYNSDDEEEDESAHGIGDEKVSLHDNDKQDFGIEVEGPENEDEDDEIQPGITKFSEGCRAFRIAFMSIMKKSVSDDSLVS